MSKVFTDPLSDRIYPKPHHTMEGSSCPKAILPCARTEPTGDLSAPLLLESHFPWHLERDPLDGLSWAFEQLPVRHPPATRKGHFPALPCIKDEEPDRAPPTAVGSSLICARRMRAVCGASSPSPSLALQSQEMSRSCDIGCAHGEFFVEESSETVERTPSIPP